MQVSESVFAVIMHGCKKQASEAKYIVLPKPNIK
jgi:hypothetical protein